MYHRAGSPLKQGPMSVNRWLRSVEMMGCGHCSCLAEGDSPALMAARLLGLAPSAFTTTDTEFIVEMLQIFWFQRAHLEIPAIREFRVLDENEERAITHRHLFCFNLPSFSSEFRILYFKSKDSMWPV